MNRHILGLRKLLLHALRSNASANRIIAGRRARLSIPAGRRAVPGSRSNVLRLPQPWGASLHFFTLLALLAATRLTAAVLLYDFERDDNVKAWWWHSGGQSQLEGAKHFATSGSSSLLFTTPSWKEDAPGWPSFERRPAVSNWMAFDRLVVDITNPGARLSGCVALPRSNDNQMEIP